jgi:pimeloyl-ACP methyl ester carboxylesterase
MKPSTSHTHPIRGLRYHVREWGDPQAPKIFLLHGWMDVSASFQFLVDAFRREWHAIAPDWRGFGLTEWAANGYWFPDYLADLEALLDLYQPKGQVNLVGHSMGGNISCLYAGIRPQRVARVVSLEGFGLPRTTPERAPDKYAQWLDELKSPPSLKTYSCFEAVALRLRQNNPRLSDEKAQWLARQWAQALPSGEIEVLADPGHKTVYPVLYRIEEAAACWSRITAPVLWVRGTESWIRRWINDKPEEFEARKRAFSDSSDRVVEGAGHMLHHDRPDQAAALIEEFLLA